MTSPICFTALLLLISVASLVAKTSDEPRNTPVNDLVYGVDLMGGADGGLKIRARVGDNVTMVARRALEPKGLANSPTEATVISMLRDAGGARCDGCKTLVEHTHTYLKELSIAARPWGQDATGKEKVTVDEQIQNEVVTKVCRSSRFMEYNDKVQGFCQEQLGGPNKRAVLRAWESVKLEDQFIPDRKRKVCTQMLQVCPAHASTAQPRPSRCRTCMEIFQTLDLMLRRDSQHIRLDAADPMAINKGRKKRADGYGGSLHVAVRMEELCTELPKHFQGAVLEDVQEACDELVEEYSGELKSAFSTFERGSDYGIPARTVCVDVAEMCSDSEFNAEYPSLLNVHMNFTNTRSKPRKKSSTHTEL